MEPLIIAAIVNGLCVFVVGALTRVAATRDRKASAIEHQDTQRLVIEVRTSVNGQTQALRDKLAAALQRANVAEGKDAGRIQEVADRKTD